MVDIEVLKISIGAIIKDPKMLKLVPDHLKTNKMCKHAVKKLQFLIKYVPDQYHTRINTLKFVKIEFLNHTVNFCVRSVFSKGPESAFSEGPGPGSASLYEVCRLLID